MKKLFLAAIVALAMVGGTACSNTTQEAGSTVKSESATNPDITGNGKAVPTDNFAYICPMKCEGSASHEQGKCPVCGMDLVENPDFRPDTETLK